VIARLPIVHLAAALASAPLCACGTVETRRTTESRSVTERWSPAVVPAAPSRLHDHVEVVGGHGSQRFERATVMRVGEDVHVIADGRVALAVPAREIVRIEARSEQHHSAVEERGDAADIAWGITGAGIAASLLLLLIVGAE